MIEAVFAPVYDNNNNIVKTVMTVTYNGKYVKDIDFPAEATMTQDEVDMFVAGKLTGLF